MTWRLSPLDWRSHAIDERGVHPIGVLIAECGHRLMMVTTLHDQPYGTPCEACAAQQFARAVKVPAPRFGATCCRADMDDDPGSPGGTALLP